jgi:hypothetical protein
MSNSHWGWIDPRSIYGSPTYGKAYTFEARKETGWFKRTYEVVRISKYAVHGDWKPYMEVLYSGLSKDAADGYVKLLKEEE